MNGTVRERAKQMKFTVATHLYNPDNRTKHSAPGVTFKTLPSANKVMDIEAMNVATDDNGNSLSMKLNRFLERSVRSDPRSLIDLKG